MIQNFELFTLNESIKNDYKSYREILTKHLDKAFNENQVKEMYENQDDEFNFVMAGYALWARARAVNYNGYSEKWPTLHIKKDGVHYSVLSDKKKHFEGIVPGTDEIMKEIEEGE